MLIPAQEQPPPRYLARIEVHTIAELNKLLTRAEQLFNSGNFNPGIDTPVAFILHGSEARSLLTPHYLQNKELVDLAARLSAFKVVEIKVCKTWMEGQSLDEELLPPFIATVPFGPAEERRLMQKQHYVYF
ncbi:MAG: hypothetical protein V3T17_07800 [Pseudomonadales bacterium]